MAVLIDPPRWPAHGRLWSHLASDTSLDELHAFADLTGIPRRAFEGDHYDVPAERYRQAVAAGAQEVEGRDLLRRLVAAGLRVPKRRGEKVLDSRRYAEWLPGGGPQSVDVVLSRLPAPTATTYGGWVVALDPSGRLLLTEDEERGWDLPGGNREPGESVVEAAVRETLEETGARVDPTALTPCGYVRVRLDGSPAEGFGYPAPWAHAQVLLARLTGSDPPGPSVAVSGDGTASRSAAWFSPTAATLQMSARDVWPLVRHLIGIPGSAGQRPA